MASSRLFGELLERLEGCIAVRGPDVPVLISGPVSGIDHDRPEDQYALWDFALVQPERGEIACGR